MSETKQAEPQVSPRMSIYGRGPKAKLPATIVEIKPPSSPQPPSEVKWIGRQPDGSFSAPEPVPAQKTDTAPKPPVKTLSRRRLFAAAGGIGLLGLLGLKVRNQMDNPSTPHVVPTEQPAPATWDKVDMRDLVEKRVSPDWSTIVDIAEKNEIQFLERGEKGDIFPSDQPELDECYLAYNTDLYHEGNFVTYRVGKPEFSSKGIEVLNKPGEKDDYILTTRVKGEMVNGRDEDWFMRVGGYKNQETGQVAMFPEDPSGVRLSADQPPNFLYHDFVRVETRIPPKRPADL